MLPPQNRTCDFHRIRLKQVTNNTLCCPKATTSQIANVPVCAPPVDGVPFGPFRRSVCSCLHLTFPSVSSPHIILWVTHHVHVGILSDRVLPYPAVPIPTGGSAFLTVGSPADRPPPDSIGVSTFRTDEIQPGRVPSILRGRGACINATAGVDHSTGPSLPSSSAIVGRPLGTQPKMTKPHRRFTSVHPSGLLLARFVLMARTLLGLSSQLRTPCYQWRTWKAETDLGALPIGLLVAFVTPIYRLGTGAFCFRTRCA
jgi:hypothetical protein